MLTKFSNESLVKTKRFFQQCDTVLELDAANVKAYYRRGLSLLGMGEPIKALEDFKKVIELEPENKAAKNQISLCEHELKTQEKREQALYTKMFRKYCDTSEV